MLNGIFRPSFQFGSVGLSQSVGEHFCVIIAWILKCMEFSVLSSSSYLKKHEQQDSGDLTLGHQVQEGP